MFTQPGRTDDFRQLKAHLYLVATDLDSGKAVEFGAAGHDDIPISLAATASSALPGLFPPVEIGGRHFVDGALKRTLHASVALKEGAKLVLCLNPLVPYDDSAVVESGGESRRLIDGGLPIVVLQTIRAVIHSRMEIGMRQYGDDYPDADVLLFEPNRADAEMFFTNMFSYSSRRRLCEHAYQKTREEIVKRRHELQPMLARHGIELNLAALRDKRKTLGVAVAKARRTPLAPLSTTTAQLAETLDDLARFVAHAQAQAQMTQNRPDAFANTPR
jgi:predicted acylesterase/phospholipase RssA